jgi:hypothetical protein
MAETACWDCAKNLVRKVNGKAANLLRISILHCSTSYLFSGFTSFQGGEEQSERDGEAGGENDRKVPPVMRR